MKRIIIILLLISLFVQIFVFNEVKNARYIRIGNQIHSISGVWHWRLANLIYVYGNNKTDKRTIAQFYTEVTTLDSLAQSKTGDFGLPQFNLKWHPELNKDSLKYLDYQVKEYYRIMDKDCNGSLKTYNGSYEYEYLIKKRMKAL